MERRVMRTWKAILTAALLASMSAAAQQAANSQASAQPPAPDASQAAQPSQPAAQQPPAAPAPTPMDQVVNLFIEREHALIEMLAKRTPVVETYLQNLTADPQ